MFRTWRTIGWAFQGKFKGNKDLMAGFFLFLFCVGVMTILSSYNAGMSFSYYHGFTSRLPWKKVGFAIALGITIGISVIFLKSASYWLDYVMDWLSSRAANRRTWLAVICFFISMTVGPWDIFTNYSGIDPATQLTLPDIDLDLSSEIGDKFDEDIKTYKDERTELKKKYNNYCVNHGYYKGAHTSNSKCKHAGFDVYPLWYSQYKAGKYRGQNSWKAAIVKRWQPESVYERILDLDTKISEQEDLKTSAQEKEQEQTNKANDDRNDLEDDTNTFHWYLVPTSYIIILILLAYTLNYMDEAALYVKKQEEGGDSSPTPPDDGNDDPGSRELNELYKYIEQLESQLDSKDGKSNVRNLWSNNNPKGEGFREKKAIPDKAYSELSRIRKEFLKFLFSQDSLSGKERGNGYAENGGGFSYPEKDSGIPDKQTRNNPESTNFIFIPDKQKSNSRTRKKKFRMTKQLSMMVDCLIEHYHDTGKVLAPGPLYQCLLKKGKDIGESTVYERYNIALGIMKKAV